MEIAEERRDSQWRSRVRKRLWLITYFLKIKVTVAIKADRQAAKVDKAAACPPTLRNNPRAS